jgi:tetratricopeptide (TPR) repeat protein
MKNQMLDTKKWRRNGGIFFFLVCAPLLHAQMESQQQRPSQPLEIQDIPQTPSLKESRDDSISTEMRIAIEELLKRKEYEKVETQLVKLIEQNPNSAPVLTFLARVFFLDGKPINCAVALKKAEKLGALKESDQYMLALSWIAMQKNDWATQEFEKMARAYPKNALYVYWLGRIEYDNYRYDAAIEKLKRALELDPESSKASDNLGLCYEGKSDFAAAFQYYEKAVQLNRKKAISSPWPPVNYAALLIKNNRMEEAEPLLKEALKYSSKMPLAHYQMGLALEKQNKSAEALDSLKKAAEYDPTMPDPHFAMIRIYRQIGEKDKAASEMQVFEKLKQAQKMKEHPTAKSDLTAH